MFDRTLGWTLTLAEGELLIMAVRTLKAWTVMRSDPLSHTCSGREREGEGRLRETCCRDKLPDLLHDTVIKCDILNHTDQHYQHYISSGPYQIEASQITETENGILIEFL